MKTKIIQILCALGFIALILGIFVLDIYLWRAYVKWLLSW